MKDDRDRHNIRSFIHHEGKGHLPTHAPELQILVMYYWPEASLSSLGTDCSKKQADKYMIFEAIKRKKVLKMTDDALNFKYK